MKFCNFLIRDINFEPESIQPCCNVYGITVPQFPFSGGPFDIQAYSEFILKTFRKINNDDIVCKGCTNLHDIDANSFDSYIQFATISLNMHRFLCNCKCVYCDFWKKVKPSYPILPSLKTIAEQNLFDKKGYVSWGGGEPSIQPDFEEASLWIEEQGWKQYIHTNAIKYSESISRILKNKNSAINISLDSSSEEIYKAVKGVNCFKKVVDNLKRYSTAEPDRIILKYIIFDLNNSIHEINNFLNLAKDLGIKNVQFSFDFRDVNQNKISKKSKIAASFFISKSESLGLKAAPFFVGNELLSEIFTNYSF